MSPATGTRSTAAAVVAAVGGLVAFVTIVAAYVVLTLNDHDAGPLLIGAVPVAAALGIVGHVEKRTQQQNSTLRTIERQTNGVMDKRIHEGATKAVRQALRDAGFVNVPAPTDPIDPPHA